MGRIWICRDEKEDRNFWENGREVWWMKYVLGDNNHDLTKQSILGVQMEIKLTRIEIGWDILIEGQRSMAERMCRVKIWCFRRLKLIFSPVASLCIKRICFKWFIPNLENVKELGKSSTLSLKWPRTQKCIQLTLEHYGFSEYQHIFLE